MHSREIKASGAAYYETTGRVDTNGPSSAKRAHYRNIKAGGATDDETAIQLKKTNDETPNFPPETHNETQGRHDSSGDTRKQKRKAKDETDKIKRIELFAGIPR